MSEISGRTLKGYQIQECIGQGGFGAVYKALETAVSREVAIKIILPEHANRPEFIRGFESEAQLVARLEHPYIIPLYTYWRDPEGAYLVMRYLRGGSLRQRLEKGALPLEEIARILDQITSALAFAHHSNVVHRDLKPDNILIDSSDNAYLTDFGIAIATGRGATDTGITGSMQYISPEQLNNQPATPAADVYSLGIVLYEMLTGNHPFGKATITELIQKHLYEPLPTLLPPLPDTLNTILQMATAKYPSERFSDIRLIASMFRKVLAGEGAPAVDTMVLQVVSAANPYKGLRAFQQADAPDFFGREALTKRLLGRMQEIGDGSRFLAVIGPSGSGKSSVARAGLLPALQKGGIPGSERWFFADMIPGPYPLDELEVALTRIASKSGVNIMEQLSRDAQGLHRVAGMLLPENGELLLLIDQFEEVFTLIEDEARRKHFLGLLTEAVTHQRSRVRIIITLRADFYDRPLMYPVFGELVRTRMETIMPLTPEELEQAICRPAERAGMSVEQKLVAAMVAEVTEQAGSLPLLQYSLTELFDNSGQNTLTLDVYNRIGGVLGALTRRADEIYAGLTQQEQDALRQIFLRLVTLGEGTEDLRRRVLRSELLSIGLDTQMVDEIINEYASYRLLTMDYDPNTREATVEVAHEALIREWQQLRQWLDQSRNDIRLQRMLATAARDWREAGHEGSYLLTGARLTQYEAWEHSTDLSLTNEEREYLDTSIREQQRQQARSRLIRNVAGVTISLVAVIFAVLALWANGERTRAEDAEQEARRQASIGLASIALREMDSGNQDTAVLLGLEALEHYPYTSQAESALAQAVEAYIPILDISDYWLFSYFWSPDGARFASNQRWMTPDGIEQDMILVMDTVSGSSLFELSLGELNCSGYDVDWSPRGERLASVYIRAGFSSSECTALPTIWDTNTGEALFQLAGHEGQVSSVKWSPDGETILTAGEDGTARVWDAEDGQEIRVIIGHNAIVSGAVWSPDGHYVATASLDSTTRIWDAATGAEILIIPHITGVTDVDWSPNGQYIATAGEDGLARIWDVTTGNIVHTLSGDTFPLLQVAYSPDGAQLATRSETNLTKIWETNTGMLFLSLPLITGVDIPYQRISWSPSGQHMGAMQNVWDISNPPIMLSGHTDEITSGIWLPDGTRIVTTSWDGTARVWDAATGAELVIMEHPERVFYSSISPDGTRLVTSCVDGIARIWDISTGELLLQVTLSKPEEYLFDEVWSPDGTRIISTGFSSPKVVWNANTGDILATLGLEATEALMRPGQSISFIFGPAWSPDSTRIATGSGGTGPIIWDAATGEPLAVFEGTWSLRVDWSPDGFYLADSNQEGAPFRVWDAVTGELLQTFTGHPVGGFGLKWSPSGNRIASGGLDGSVKVWNPFTGEELRSFQAPGSAVNIDWSPDERYIIVIGSFNTPIIRRVWPSTQALIDEAKACCVTRELTPEERTQFGLPPRNE